LAALITGLAVSYLVVSNKQEQTKEALAQREQALLRERETSYFQTIALTAPEALANNVQRADRLLDGCAAEGSVRFLTDSPITCDTERATDTPSQSQSASARNLGELVRSP
jgi:hypothetical protein